VVYKLKIKLKNNKEVNIRSLNLKDEEKLFLMFSSMSKKALRWSNTPFTRAVIKHWIDNLPSLIALVVEYDNSIVGFGFIQKFRHLRRKGVGDLTIYLHHDFHHFGLGTIIMKKLLELARKDQMHKIEHSIVSGNKPAIGLYKKFDFKIEGLSRESFMDTEGRYLDLVNVGLILE
jgi:L-amino acid N-acyltransferase YncA